MATATKNEVFVTVMQSIMAVYLDFLSQTGADLETSGKGIGSSSCFGRLRLFDIFSA